MSPPVADAGRDLAGPIVDLSPGVDAAATPDLSTMDAAMGEADLRVPPDLARAADLTTVRDLSADTCGSLEQRYLGMVEQAAAKTCVADADCAVVTGHCGVGLGGCNYVVNRTVRQADLDDLALRWKAMGCDAGRPVCRCIAPPMVQCKAMACAPI